MSNPVGAQRYGLGGGDAYYDAVKYGGYTGTRKQFGRDQAEFAQNATAVAEAREEVEQNTQTVVNTAQTFTEETVPAAIQSVEEKGDTEEDRLELRTTELVEAVNTAGAVQVQAVRDEGTTQTGLVSDAGTAQVEAVEQAGSDQVDAVELAGSTQVGNVNSAGTTQVGNVDQAGTTQVGNVNTAGAAQVQAVEDKGEEVLNSIPEDYSDLAEEVDNLKTAITEQSEQLGDTIIVSHPQATADKSSDIFITYGTNGYVSYTDGHFTSDSDWRILLLTFNTDNSVSVVKNNASGVCGAVLYSQELQTIPTSSAQASTYYVRGARSDKEAYPMPTPESPWSITAGQMLAVFLRVNPYTDNNFTLTLTDYDTNVITLNNGVKFNTNQNKAIEDIAGNVLYGKKWVVCGDSFTNGADTGTISSGRYAGNKIVYPYLIGNRNNMEIVKFFNGGRTLAFPEEPGDFVNSLTAPDQIYNYQNIPADADYITIYLGINDSHHETGSGGDDEDDTGVIPLGTISDNTIYTYYGAWNVVLTWLLTNRPYAHIGIIVSNGCDRIAYRTAQIDIAKKYGISYIDLNGDARTRAMIRPQNEDISADVKTLLLISQAVDYNGGNTHPNNEAHKLESLFIEDFLRSL